MKKKLWFVLRLSVTTLLIYWLLRNVNVASILDVVRYADLRFILLAYCLIIMGHIISVLRWRVLLRAQGGDAPLIWLGLSYMVCLFFNNLLPSTIGGDSSRLYDTWRIIRSKGRAAAVIFVDRLFGLFALLVFAAAMFLLMKETGTNLRNLYTWHILGLTGMGLMTYFIFVPDRRILTVLARIPLPFSAKIHAVLSKILDSFALFNHKRGALARALLLSLLLQINVIFHYYFISKALSMNVAFYHFLVIVPSAIFIMMLPISINGIGLRENIFVFFLLPFGVAKPNAVALAWIAYSFTLLQGIIGGIIYALRSYQPSDYSTPPA